jgi:hypothetical protein
VRQLGNKILDNINMHGTTVKKERKKENMCCVYRIFMVFLSVGKA